MRFHVFVAAMLLCSASAGAATLTENFDQVGGFFGATGQGTPSVPVVSGWSVKNNSTAGGTRSWHSGSAASQFPPQFGTGFAAVDAFSTAAQNTISNWLITPQISFSSGDQISFWTRTGSPVDFPDRLQVYLSTAGASTNVGATETSLGDFTTLLRDINPNYVQVGAGSYPTTWTQFTLTVPNSGTGRVGFRYFVTNGGPSGTNGNFIGIDSLNIVAVPEPGTLGLLSLIGAGILSRRRRSQQK
ncbi:hypothetical protein BH09PLA1_BH09PLA1_12350 [soil metagenome]